MNGTSTAGGQNSRQACGAAPARAVIYDREGHWGRPLTNGRRRWRRFVYAARRRVYFLVNICIIRTAAARARGRGNGDGAASIRSRSERRTGGPGTRRTGARRRGVVPDRTYIYSFVPIVPRRNAAISPAPGRQLRVNGSAAVYDNNSDNNNSFFFIFYYITGT